MFIAEGDSSTISLREIAFGTAQNDSGKMLAGTKRFCYIKRFTRVLPPVATGA